MPEMNVFDFLGIALDCLVVIACGMVVYVVLRWAWVSRGHQ